MEKRYQVFVSSTYADLQEERRRVIQTLMEMDCIPAGMEIFPAVDEEQWKFIKTIIDDCDYYLLIIGGRYGSISSEGISYTEKEYDYAVSIGLKVIALVHEHPEEIPVKNTEKDPKLQKKLEDFKNKVTAGRLVRFWNFPQDLPGLVATSLSKTIKTHPAVGWVRGNLTADPQIYSTLEKLRIENMNLQKKIVHLEDELSPPIVNDLVDFDDVIEIAGEYQTRHGDFTVWGTAISWKEIFRIIAPFLMENPNDIRVNEYVAKETFRKTDKYGYSPSIDEESYQTIKVQLMALGLVDVKYSATTTGTTSLFWTLTRKGLSTMYEIRTVKKK